MALYLRRASLQILSKEKGAPWCGCGSNLNVVCILEALKAFSVICPFCIPHGCSNFQQGNEGYKIYSFSQKLDEINKRWIQCIIYCFVF